MRDISQLISREKSPRGTRNSGNCLTRSRTARDARWT
jgi:hypothetical protein